MGKAENEAQRLLDDIRTILGRIDRRLDRFGIEIDLLFGDLSLKIEGFADHLAVGTGFPPLAVGRINKRLTAIERRLAALEER